MPKYQYSSEFGDLFVTYDVEFPKKLTPTQITQLKMMFGKK